MLAYARPDRAATRPEPGARAAPGHRTFFDAWVDSAYGVEGFWRRQRPAQHFRTAAGTGPLLAELLDELIDAAAVTAVVDVGAGDGDLLAGLARRHPGLALTGIDLRERPLGLPGEIAWRRDLWDVRRGAWTSGAAPELLRALAQPTLIVATEWLDDLPCPVLVRCAHGWRELVVAADGRTLPGPPATPTAAAWADRWSPAGSVVEVGLTRDEAWADLVGHAVRSGGAALLVDYGHVGTHRPAGDSLAGYRAGRAAAAVPSSWSNLTAHVAVDALRTAGEVVGAATGFCGRQRDAAEWLLPAPSPAPATSLADLVERNARQVLTAPGGWGAHWWLYQVGAG